MVADDSSCSNQSIGGGADIIQPSGKNKGVRFASLLEDNAANNANEIA